MVREMKGHQDKHDDLQKPLLEHTVQSTPRTTEEEFQNPKKKHGNENNSKHVINLSTSLVTFHK